ncbi:MAG TPA: sporulation protein YqfC [Symbiobacteriaceae bacterium]|nr:sporulation protein YqfC [Symbiobacteriaceae bacterium]
MAPKKARLAAKVASMLELPGEILTNSCRVTLLGQERLVIENHRGLLVYTGRQILLQTPEGRLLITGENLNIGTIAPDQVSVDGPIRGLEYLDGGS